MNFFYKSQSYIDLPKRAIRNNSNKTILFNQTLKDTENKYRDVGGYDITYYEIKQWGRGTWKEEYNCLCIDRSKKRDQGRFCFCNESRNTFTERILETKRFLLT